MAMAGIEEARSAGQEATYGNFLRGNGADSLFLLGRWDESRQLGETALEWSPVGVAYVNAVTNLAIVEVESRAGERAGRLLGRLLLELETVPDAQTSVPAYRAAASFALWRGDIEDARRVVELGWAPIRDTEDWVLIAKMAASVVETDAAVIADARDRRDLAALAAARERSREVLAAAEAAVAASAGVARTIGSRREADAHLATARAFQARFDGRDDASAWDALARTWESIEMPYQVARARWRQAEAALGAGDGRSGRSAARRPLLDAVRLARELGARPLLRELEELAGRARIPIPEDAEAGIAGPLDGLASTVADGARRSLDGPAERSPDGRASLASSSGRPARSRRCSGSARASARSCSCCRPGAPTGRSASTCSSARRRSASTSATSWPSSACPAGSRPPRWRSAWGLTDGAGRPAPSRPARARLDASPPPPVPSRHN